jgi:hypothetical protein
MAYRFNLEFKGLTDFSHEELILLKATVLGVAELSETSVDSITKEKHYILSLLLG